MPKVHPDDIDWSQFQHGVHCCECCQDITEEECNCDDYCEGRFIGEVCAYASTCDWCHELTMHENMEMDLRTQLGYCEECQKLPQVAAMIETGIKACPDGEPLLIEFDSVGNNIWTLIFPVEPSFDINK